MYVVSPLEQEFGRTAIKEMLPMQPGDVEATYADVTELEHDIGFRPRRQSKTALPPLQMASRTGFSGRTR